MDERVQQALQQDRVIDITTIGRKSGRPRRKEIWFHNLNQSQGKMYIYVTMMINCVAPVNLPHPYLENAPAPSVDPHCLRISPWL